jgi:hypothetical protein
MDNGISSAVMQAKATDSYLPFFLLREEQKLGVRGYSILCVAVYVSGIKF